MGGSGDRYRKIRLLGEGGAGRVWRVEDRLRPASLLALKELTAARPEKAEALRREFATLAALEHPNLVEVHEFDLDPESRLPRFSLEYIEGEDFVATVRREGPPSFAPLAAEALRALSFLHDFGLIHRDLKPQNMLVRREPRLGSRVVILDFGLALRGALEEEAIALSGTPAYLAPELLEGVRPDKRSDLYSLGVVLFEAVYGRPPWSPEGKDLAEFLADLRRGKRIRPELPEGYPRELASFLDELLAVDPADRMPSGREALARLNRIFGTEFSDETELTRQARLRSGPPPGREAELREIWAHLEQEETPRVVWVSGDAGMGKTRVLRWIRAEGVSRGWEVVLAPGLSTLEEADGFLEQLRERAKDHPTVLLVDELERAWAGVVRVIERVARERGEPPVRIVGALRPGEIEHPALKTLYGQTGIVPPLREVKLGVLGRQALRALVERVRGQELVWEGRLEWLEEVSEGNPLLAESLLVEGAWERGGEGRVVAGVLKDSIGRRVERLSEPARLWLEALAIFPAPVEAEGVVFVAELSAERASWALREAVASGLAQEAGMGRYAAASRLVREEVVGGLGGERRLGMARRGLEWAERQDWPPDALARLYALAGNGERAIGKAVEAAEAVRKEDPAAAAGWYGFALRHVGRNRTERRGLRLEQARAYLEANLPDSAVRPARAAVNLSRTEPERAEALGVLGEALAFRPELGPASRVLEEALVLTEKLGWQARRARLLRFQGVLLGKTGLLERALEVLRAAATELERAGDNWTLCEALQNIAVCTTALRHKEGEDSLRRGLELARAIGHRRQEALALIVLSRIQRDRGHLQDALATLAEAKARLRSPSLRPLLSYVLTEEAITCSQLGDLDSYVQYAREAAAEARHSGDINAILSAANLVACSFLGTGQYAQAEETLRQALSLPGATRYPRRLWMCRLTLAETLTESGRLAEADEVLDGLRAQIEEIPDRAMAALLCLAELERCAAGPSERSGEALWREYQQVLREEQMELECELAVRALLAYGTCLLRSGKLGEAFERAREAVARAEEYDHQVGLARAYLLLSECHRQAGQEKEAAEALERGRRVLEEAARRISDAELRQGFLKRGIFRELLEAPERAPKTPDARLLALYDIVRSLNSQTDPEAVLEIILEAALQTVGAERGLILLREGEDFTVRAARHFEEKETEEDARAYSLTIAREAHGGQSILSMDAAADERFKAAKSISLYRIRSLMCVPLRSRGRILGTVYLDTRERGKLFTEEDLRFLEALADHAALALENARTRARLEEENRRLLRLAEERVRLGNLVGRSKPMQEVFDRIERFAQSELPVLIQGESGTGKELVARAIHVHSPRRRKIFLSENCAAIPESLLESELFGHVRGAFTGAERDRAGLFEQADGGTLFLDEVGEMSPAMQARLLRVLEEGELRRVGGGRAIRVDVRIVAATNRDLEQLVREGRFREDLLYRLQVLTIQLPALRERYGDIPLLVAHFLEKIAQARGRPVPRIADEVVEILERARWPGNVRQLENVLQRLVLLAGEDPITKETIESDGQLRRMLLGSEPEPVWSLERSEREQIRKALEAARGNPTRAAKMLGISRATIYRKIKEYGLR